MRVRGRTTSRAKSGQSDTPLITLHRLDIGSGLHPIIFDTYLKLNSVNHLGALRLLRVRTTADIYEGHKEARFIPVLICSSYCNVEFYSRNLGCIALIAS